MPTRQEGGTRPSERWFCVEELNQYGSPVTPQDPDWLPYSSVVTSTEPDSDIPMQARIGIGNIDPVDKVKQQESHALTVQYHLERFPVDKSGNPVDPWAHAVVRTQDQELANTNSYLEVEHKQTIIPRNTFHERYFDINDGATHPSGNVPNAAPLGMIQALYGYGGRGEEVALSCSPSDSGIATVELPYQFSKLRPYQIDQPNAKTTLAVRSTDKSDTKAEVVIENEDASKSETVTLDGADATKLVSTTTKFSSIRCVDVSQDDQEGNIEVYINTGNKSAAAGQLLTVVYGKHEYSEIESDEGIPAVNKGSFGDGSSLTGKQYSIGSELRWDNRRAGQYVSSATFTVANEIESTETLSDIATSKSVDGREVTAEGTVFGQTESTEKFSSRLRGSEGTLALQLVGGDIYLPRSYISDGGMAAREEEQAQMNVDVTWRGMQPENGGPAIAMTNAANL